MSTNATIKEQEEMERLASHCRRFINAYDEFYPDYPVDLGAYMDSISDHLADGPHSIREAWNSLGWEEKNECVGHLKEIVKEADCEAYFATDAQKREAILKTLNSHE